MPDGGSAEAGDMGFFLRHDGCDGLLLYYASRPAAFHVANATTRRRAALPAPRARTVLSVLLFDPCVSPRFKVLCFTGWLHRCAAIELFDSERARGERSPVRCRALPWPLAHVQRRHAPQEWALKHKIGVGDVVPGGSSQAITFLFMAFHPEVERSGVPVVAVEAARCVEE